MLDAAEAEAVVICLRAAAGGSVEGVEEAAARVLSRLEPMLPANMRPGVAALSASTAKLESRGEAVDRAVLVEVSRGCRESEQLTFSYRDGGGRESDRRVEPYRVVNAGRRWYLVAREPLRDEWRTFRMDRIGSPRLTGHVFQRDDPPDAVALVHAAITTSPYRYQARVELDAPLTMIAELVPATVGVLEAIDDHTTMLTTGGDNLDYLAMHIAMLDVGFRVHEPRRCASGLPCLRRDLLPLVDQAAVVGRVELRALFLLLPLGLTLFLQCLAGLLGRRLLR